LGKDRSFTYTIDRGNYGEQLMIKEAGKSLARQIKEVVVPEIDVYRIATWSAAAIANLKTATAAITASNAYVKFLDAQASLDESKVPISGRICFVTPAYYNFLKQDPTFIKASDMAQKMLINGQVGEVDGVKIIKVPSSYFPANHAFILMHPSCTISPKKLEDYKTHDNPPGISGWLVEGREIYDCFVLTAKKDAIFAHKTAA
jgi:N4-gp56 family major capsid protein